MAPFDDNGFLGNEVKNVIQDNKDQYQDIYILAYDLNSFCQSTIFKIDVKNNETQKVLVATLFIRVLHNYQAAILIAEHGLIPQAKVLARAFIEAIFCLCSITKNEDHAKEYVFENQKQRLKSLYKYKEYRGKLSEIEETELHKIEHDLKDDIDKNNIKLKSTEQWAKEADMHDVYLTAYSMMSHSVHTKVKDLERYLVLNAKKEICEFNIYPNNAGIEVLLITLIEGMLRALKCCHSLFNILDEDKFQELHDRLKKIAMQFIKLSIDSN